MLAIDRPIMIIVVWGTLLSALSTAYWSSDPSSFEFIYSLLIFIASLSVLVLMIYHLYRERGKSRRELG